MAEKQIEVSTLNQIKPWKSSWSVHVMITHAWKSGNSSFGESLDFIIMDEEGTKMHCSMRASEFQRLRDSIVVGSWKEITNLTVKNATGGYRPTPHPFRVFVLNNTKIDDIDEKPVRDRPILRTFHAIKFNNLNQNFLIDVVGQVTNVSDMELKEVGSQPTKKIDVTLRDAGNDDLKLTVWGPYADKIWQGCLEAEDGQVICLIKYAKIKTWNGENYLSNAFDATILIINPTNIAEVIAFKQALPRDDFKLNLSHIKPIEETALVVHQKENFEDYPLLNIEQILQSGDVGKCRVICSIFAIDCDYAWYYFNCKTCTKSVHLKEDLKDPKRKQRWWCEPCNTFPKSIIPRYRLYVKVKDETSEMRCILFDNNANKVVSQSASKILNGSTAPIVDPTNLPQALRNIVGTTWQLCVSIEANNIQDEQSTYKVVKVWPPHQMIGEDSQSSGLISGLEASSMIGTEEAPLLITLSDDKSDHVISETETPSSKRKEEFDVDAPDESSTTSKMMSITKKIKLEEDENNKKTE